MAATCLVVMGVSGSGKSTVAELLARRLGWVFAEGDEFHSAANVAKMRAGEALTDADREPWLAALRDWIGEQADAGRSTVVTCSALRHHYRDVLREASARVRFVHLDGSRDLIAERLGHRKGHFMPPALLDSQLAALEPLVEGEDGIRVDVAHTPEEIVAQVVAYAV
ncbi:gluconokinase [Glycomyces endophyticus]|uniref:Gluconokinase n=1 Tax=Glycomyces endophyticus TaxID=480996 RepID=A0ABP4SKJ3_9ACTN